MNTPENQPKEPRSVVLLLHCPLRLGLAASLTQFIYSHRGRILYHDLEKVVLSRAIWSHLRWKIIVHRGRTVVFD